MAPNTCFETPLVREMKFIPPDRTAFVPFEIDGHQVNAVLDSAGQDTVLSHQFFNSLSVKPDHLEPLLL